MSGLGISEFEESMWDEFFRVDHHMVPNYGLECSNDHFPWHDNLRNTLCEVNCNSTHSENGSVSKYAHLGRKQGGGCSSLHDKCSSISDTDLLSCKRSAMFPFSSESDLMDETSSVAFDDARSSCHAFKINSEDSQNSEFPENGTYLDDGKTPVDNQSETTRQECSFVSFENINSTDFFSGVCPDIQSFEDVEMIFRSSETNSTFDVGVNKDELSWLSPDNDEGDFRLEFSCPKSSIDANMSEDKDSFESYSADDSALASVPIKFEDNYCSLEKSDSDIPFVYGPAIADSKDGLTSRDKSIGSCRYLNDLPIKVILLPSEATSYENPSAHFQQQQKQALGSPNHISNAFLEKNNLPDPISVNQQNSAVNLGIKKIDKQRNDQGRSTVSKSLTEANIMGQANESASRSVGKQIRLRGDKCDDTIDADGVSQVNPAKLGSSNVQESLMGSLDDISPEAASFAQLQLVMKWLDYRTRLCIRDGLYRLAQGAEQRHNHANLFCSSGDGKTSVGLFIEEGINKYTNLMNKEADTNPIDRSIAHLLFYRPSNSCAISAHD